MYRWGLLKHLNVHLEEAFHDTRQADSIFSRLTVFWALASVPVPRAGAIHKHASPPGILSGSVPVKPVAGTLQISMQDAIDRGLKQNLGVLISGYETRAARGQHWQQLSALLPIFPPRHIWRYRKSTWPSSVSNSTSGSLLPNNRRTLFIR